MSITIKCYSEKGLCVVGITADQAQTILGNLGKAVTQYNPQMGGYVFSRKRETLIREIVAGFGASQASGSSCESAHIPAVDDLPGKWGLLANA